jgi:hypothetical protein
MSLEAKIEALTAAVANLTQVIVKIEAAQGTAPAPVITAPAVAAAPVAPPVAATPATPAAVMPPPPSFAPPVAPPVAAAPAPTGVPFNDAKGLMAYVMASYQTLGPQKGAQIQTVLSGLGVQNINDVKPEQYAALYNGIEQLKGAA